MTPTSSADVANVHPPHNGPLTTAPHQPPTDDPNLLPSSTPFESDRSATEQVRPDQSSPVPPSPKSEYSTSAPPITSNTPAATSTNPLPTHPTTGGGGGGGNGGEVAHSTPTPVMGMMNTFADMTLGPIPYPAQMHLMPMQPHQVVPLVPPQHVPPQLQPPHRQPQPHPHAHPHAHAHAQAHAPHLINNINQGRTSAYHWVPKDRVGAVIGGHGAVIRSLQDKSGAVIQVHNATVRDEHKLFTITGYPTQIDSAIQLIVDIVGHTRSGHTTPNPSDRLSSHSNQSYPQQQSPHHVNNGVQNQSQQPHNSQFNSPSTTASPRHPSSRPNPHFKTIFVPTSCVGLVIGRNGDTIRNLQDNSGAEIKVTPDQQAQPGQPNRSILITGTEEAIAIANRLVMEIVMDARSRRQATPPPPPLGSLVNGEMVIMEELRVPNEKVGLIIGKKGVAIRELQMRSGAKIQVTKDDNSIQTDGTRPVSITGTKRQVDDARSLIAAKISVPYLTNPAIGVQNSATSPASSGHTTIATSVNAAATANAGSGGAVGSGTTVTCDDVTVGASEAGDENQNLGYGYNNQGGNGAGATLGVVSGATSGFEGEYENGQAIFQQQVYDGSERNNQGRTRGSMNYAQYGVPYNSYGIPAGGSHTRMSGNVGMPLGFNGSSGGPAQVQQHHHQQTEQEQEILAASGGALSSTEVSGGGESNGSRATDSGEGTLFSAEGVVTRDGNGNVLMFGGHAGYVHHPHHHHQLQQQQQQMRQMQQIRHHQQQQLNRSSEGGGASTQHDEGHGRETEPEHNEDIGTVETEGDVREDEMKGKKTESHRQSRGDGGGNG